jgi:siderophore synthetase component
MRTVTISPELGFPYHLKLALACQITSALRTITPWTACGGLEVSELLQKLLPSDLWVFNEAAAVCGSQEDFNEAKHLSCILREDLESRATASGETLILAAALAQRPVNDSRSHAERVFGLDTLKKRVDWFRRYGSLVYYAAHLTKPTSSILRFRRRFKPHS